MRLRVLGVLGLVACSAPSDAVAPRALLPGARLACTEPPTCLGEPAEDYAATGARARVVAILRRELPEATVTELEAGLVTRLASGATEITVVSTEDEPDGFRAECPLLANERTVVSVWRRHVAAE